MKVIELSPAEQAAVRAFQESFREMAQKEKPSTTVLIAGVAGILASTGRYATHSDDDAQEVIQQIANTAIRLLAESLGPRRSKH